MWVSHIPVIHPHLSTLHFLPHPQHFNWRSSHTILCGQDTMQIYERERVYACILFLDLLLETHGRKPQYFHNLWEVRRMMAHFEKYWTVQQMVPVGCTCQVRPLMENLFTYHANGLEKHSRPPKQVPSAGLFNIFGSGLSFFVLQTSVDSKGKFRSSKQTKVNFNKLNGPKFNCNIFPI